jgi:hypothetical protein
VITNVLITLSEALKTIFKRIKRNPEYNLIIGFPITGAAPFQGFQSLEFGCGVELGGNGPCLSVPAACVRGVKNI